jgi:hypothetical protein
MDDITTDQTIQFIEKLWYQWGVSLIEKICSEYEIPDDVRQQLFRLYLRQNDWNLYITDNRNA